VRLPGRPGCDQAARGGRLAAPRTAPFVTEPSRRRMTFPGTVGGHERLRLFCALTLPDDVLDRLERWQADALDGGRIVPGPNLHITLAFLGHRPTADLEPVAAAVREAA